VITICVKKNKMLKKNEKNVERKENFVYTNATGCFFLRLGDIKLLLEVRRSL